MSIVSYAQNFEDVMLWRALKDVRNGFFIDVGAQSPDLDSVTRAFSDAGWRGINIEPHPEYFELLVLRRPEDINLRCALGDQVGVVAMNFIERTGLSTADDFVAARHAAAGYVVRRQEAQLTTLDQVWRQHVANNQPVHFLKVDVEGFELQVLRGNDWRAHRPWIVVVESTLPNSQVESHAEWEHLLVNADYLLAYEDGLNRFYVAREHDSLLQSFRFPPNVFDAFEPIAVLMERDRSAKLGEDLSNEQERTAFLRAQLSKEREAVVRLKVDLALAGRTAQEAMHRIAAAEGSFLAARAREWAALIAVRRLEQEATATNQAAQAASLSAEEGRRQVQQMLASTSWRLTAPLRRFGGRLPLAARHNARRLAKLVWWMITPWKLKARLEFIRARKTASVPKVESATTTSWNRPWTEFSLYDDEALAQISGGQWEAGGGAPGQIVDRLSAMRIVVDVLRKSSDLRSRFPRALSDPLASGFFDWFESTESSVRLGDGGRHWLNKVLTEDVAARARQIYLLRDDVRRRWPHGLTPPGHPQLLGWFLKHAKDEYQLSDVEILWLFMRAAEAPALELVRAYLFNPEWQERFADGLTVFGRQAFADWFSQCYEVGNVWWIDPAHWPQPNSPGRQIRQGFHARSVWRANFPLALENESEASRLIEGIKGGALQVPAAAREWCASRDAEPLATEVVAPGINLIGHFCSASGVRISAENLAQGLTENGVAVSMRSLRTDIGDEPRYVEFHGQEDFDITVIHTQPTPYFCSAYELANLAQREPAPYRIAYWYWEFDSVPDSWRNIAACVDEVWTASEFVASGLRKSLSVPVRTIFPGVRLPAFSPCDRSQFGISPNAFVCLFVFHMNSVMERKNPLGLIRAFRKAFEAERSATLVLKTMYGHRHPALMEEIRNAAGSANVQVIDETYDQSQLLALMSACDAYVSLHRSEGLGLTMAEAMLLGKPVVATGYSGNLDFMDESNSLLVDFQLRKLGRDLPPYEADATWAEPSVDHAAELMRKLFDDRDFANELGRKARASAVERLSVATAGARAAARLWEIRADRARRRQGYAD